MTKLPDIMTPKLWKEADRLYLDFISSLYISGRRCGKILRTDLWFLQEIAHSLVRVYPEKRATEIEDILVHIIQQADKETS